MGRIEKTPNPTTCTQRRTLISSPIPSRSPIILMTCLLLFFLPSTLSQCLELPTPTLSSLNTILLNSRGRAQDLCPFTITSDSCDVDSTTGLQVSDYGRSALIACTTSRQPDEQCVIDCRGRHFTVGSSEILVLNGMTLRGATSSSVYIGTSASLSSFETTWEYNSNDENGGAIVVEFRGYIFLRDCDFRYNQAQGNGGAVYVGNTAVAQIRNSNTFEDNTASKGGAIYVVTRSTLALLSSFFVNNDATDGVGSAIFVESVVNYRYAFGNTGCGHDGSLAVPACDGIYDSSLNVCKVFENECVAPTVSPTISPAPSREPRPTLDPDSGSIPTDTPTISVTSSPTLRPSKRASMKPSSSPTFYPSYTPSDEPTWTTETPSDVPSDTPTKVQSSIPTIVIRTSSPTTLAPTIEPTPMPTLPPSDVPTSEPTFEPTGLPTVLPTSEPTGEPSGEPSRLPTLDPTYEP